MTQEEIIRMAREAGFETEDWANGTHVIVYESGREIDITNELERFAALVAANEREKHNSPSWETVDDAIAAEREACAKVCETDELCCKCGDECAEAIRARGEN